jgi:hypothetical protein
MNGYYLKVCFKEKYDGRKVWYFNNTYLCDYVNTTFPTKADAEKWIPEIMSKPQYPYLQGKNIESITVKRRR